MHIIVVLERGTLNSDLLRKNIKRATVAHSAHLAAFTPPLPVFAIHRVQHTNIISVLPPCRIAELIRIVNGVCLEFGILAASVLVGLSQTFCQYMQGFYFEAYNNDHPGQGHEWPS